MSVLLNENLYVAKSFRYNYWVGESVGRWSVDLIKPIKKNMLSYWASNRTLTCGKFLNAHAEFAKRPMED